MAFIIRVATSGTADATLSLQDRQGITFGATQTTHITSALQISDKTGFIIIGIACCLELWDCGANPTVRRIQTNEFFRWP